MLTTDHFRIRVIETGEWVIGSSGEGYLTMAERARGLIFGPDERHKWEGDKEFEIIPLTETEIMERLPPEIAPRLPGFEEV